MDGGAWWAAVHGVAKSWTQLSNFPFTFPFHALEKEMAIHSSVLAWRIPGMREPGGLPSMGSHSRTQLKQLSSSSSLFSIAIVLSFQGCLYVCFLWPCHMAYRISVPQPGIESRCSAVEVWNPNHWTTREYPPLPFFLFN